MKRITTCMILAALAFVPAAAGVVFELETTETSGPVTISEVSVQQPNLRMKVLSGKGAGGEEIVWRGDKRQMIVISHGDRSYMVIDKQMIEALLAAMPGAGKGSGKDPGMDAIEAQMAEAMKKMEEEMAGLDPEEREMVESMLKGSMPSPAAEDTASRTAIRPTAEKGTMKEYPCVRYDAMRGKEKVREIWVTGWDQVAGGKEAMTVMKDMAGFFEEIQDIMKKAPGPAASMFSMDGTPLADLAGLDGFPVVTRDFEEGALESETSLRSATGRALDAAVFEPPAGYSPRSMGAP